LFESLTRSILKASRSSRKRLAGDGTVIEAACSRYGLLKEEAVRQSTERAREALARTQRGATALSELLNASRVLPFVTGELALGRLQQRDMGHDATPCIETRPTWSGSHR
jgi:hypothetical protein